MRRLSVWVAVCALTLSVLPVRAQDVPTGLLFGHVTDPNGFPLAGALVVVADVPSAVAITADDGGYGLSLPAGDHAIAVLGTTYASDQILVTIPQDDAAFVDVVAMNPVAQPQPQQADPTPTPVPVVEQPTPTPVPPPPTATPVPVPTAVVVQTGQLSGSVKNPDGSQPIPGTTVLIVDVPIFQASTGTGGAYSVSGVPLGRHFVVATDPFGAVSDSYQVSMTGDTVLNMNLQRFPAGQPTLFIGHVLTEAKSAVSGATVWRMGGANVTSSHGDGTFQLVDAGRGASDANSTTLGQAPDNVVFVAVKDDRWGMLKADAKNPGRLEITLDRQGNAPSHPAGIGFTNGMNVQAHGEQYFTARWPANQNLAGPTIHIKGSKGFDSLTGANPGVCVGDCGSNSGGLTWLVAKLPRDQDARVFLEDNGGNPWSGNPVWDEPQVVRLNP